MVDKTPKFSMKQIIEKFNPNVYVNKLNLFELFKESGSKFIYDEYLPSIEPKDGKLPLFNGISQPPSNTSSLEVNGNGMPVHLEVTAMDLNATNGMLPLGMNIVQKDGSEISYFRKETILDYFHDKKIPVIYAKNKEEVLENLLLQLGGSSLLSLIEEMKEGRGFFIDGVLHGNPFSTKLGGKSTYYYKDINLAIGKVIQSLAQKIGTSSGYSTQLTCFLSGIRYSEEDLVQSKHLTSRMPVMYQGKLVYFSIPDKLEKMKDFRGKIDFDKFIFTKQDNNSYIPFLQNSN